MIQLLNKISWLISITLGILIVVIFGGEIETLLIGIILGVIVKGVLLPRNYIESRVTHFARVALKQENIDSGSTLHNTIKTEPLETLEKRYIKKQAHTKEDSIFNTVEDFIKTFFSENILAKIGGILVFLGVLFLLSLVWSAIPGVLKIAIGFTIGIISYLAGVQLDKKGLPNEGKILLGVGILINYAVILSGRYLIGTDSIDMNPIFTAGISFIFLILNTLFAVGTALFYKSGVFLMFSFFFAYLCPFLVGGDSSTPYVLVGYSLIVSIGALFLAKRGSNIFLLLIAFFLGNFLIFIAPNFVHSETYEMGYMTKYLSLIGLSLVSLLSAINMNIKEKGFIEILFGATFFAVGLFGFVGTSELHATSYFMSIAAAFIFMLFSYTYMKQWPYLYAIGTIAGGIILSSHLDWFSATLLTYNVISISLYLCLNVAGAFILKIQDDSHLKNLVLGSVSGILCTGTAVYLYSTQNYESTLFMGSIYLGLAILYGVISCILFQKFGTQAIKEDSYKRNTLYNFLAIALSLFSLAGSLIFSDYHFVVALFWLLESAILLFFFLKIKDIKIMIAGFILMGLGIMQWFTELGNVNALVQYIAPAFVMFGVLVFNLTRLKDIHIEQLKGIHEFLHVCGIIGIIVGITLALQGKTDSTIIASLALFLWILGYIYKIYGNILLKKWFHLLFILMLFGHIAIYADGVYGGPLSTFHTLFQYGISSVLMLAGAAYIFPDKNHTNSKQWIITSGLIYLFIMTTLYIYHIFPNTFAITLYWGILSFLLISRGIYKDTIRVRTIGLYLVMLVCAKIVLIDISTGINDAIIKVVAFIGVGIMFISIGTMYSRKYGNKLKGEFDLSNIFGGEPITQGTLGKK